MDLASNTSAPKGSMAAERRRHRVGVVLVLAAATLWSLGGVGVKVVDAHPMAIAGYRSLFALPVMLGVVLARVRGGADARSPLTRPHAWIAAASYALMVVCFVVATKLTTAANAILLQYTGPMYVALFSWRVLGERVRAWDWLTVAACVVGMGLFFGDALSAAGKWGNAVAIVSSFGFAGMPLALRREQLVMERTRREREVVLSPTVAIALGNAMAVVVCVPWMAQAPPSGARAWETLAFLGACQIGLPYVLYAIAVRRMRAIESSLLPTIEPILSPLWVLFATGERPGAMAVMGGALIVAAVVTQGVSAARG